MARLKRADPCEPGYTRVRRGEGFEYLDFDGNPVEEEEVLARIRSLVIPPAWKDVWICPYPMGHIQATGVDAAGRKQYRYHDKWRERRDQEKFDEMFAFARALPRMRGRVAGDLERKGLPREKALACAVRLLDRGFFRVGGEGYAVENETYGLATMRKEHVAVRDGSIIFDYPAKSGQRVMRALVDRDVCHIIETMKRRRGGGPELLAYKRGSRWLDIRSEDINEYVKEVMGGNFSAKDFRTWNATLLAAVALAVSGPVASGSRTARKRAETRAVKEVAHYLGNTPAVARSSYIDPRVFDRFNDGLTIGGALAALVQEDGINEPSVQSSIEQAVLELIADERTEAIEKVA